MEIRNKTNLDLDIPAAGVTVAAGETADVADDIGAGLLEQGDVWEESTGARPSVADVLTDVGDDPDRARTALAVEQQADKPRKTLVARLEEIIASSEETV